MKNLQDIKTIGIVGLGLIGSSIARGLKAENVAEHVIGLDMSQDVCDESMSLGFLTSATTNPEDLKDVDVVFLCVPVGAVKEAAEMIMPHLPKGAIITDVSSTKGSVIKDMAEILREGLFFVPGHPIAGTEKSGPSAGFAELFHGRWCIITPDETTSLTALETVRQIWEALGSRIEFMDVKQHDQVLAMTSHLPHLIAYTIVGTATDLGEDIKSKVIEYSAGGFRDFTRIAASNPYMWRDVFVNNQEAVLDVLQRFTEDLTHLQKAIRRGNGELLFDYFSKTRSIHAEVIQAKQDHDTDEGQ